MNITLFKAFVVTLKAWTISWVLKIISRGKNYLTSVSQFTPKIFTSGLNAKKIAISPIYIILRIKSLNNLTLEFHSLLEIYAWYNCYFTLLFRSKLYSILKIYSSEIKIPFCRVFFVLLGPWFNYCTFYRLRHLLFQMVKLQESPDDMPPGQTPHTVVVYAHGDLVSWSVK